MALPLSLGYALAQEPSTTPAPPSAVAPVANQSPSGNVTMHLIQRLVQRGVLKEQDASELLQVAKADAEAEQAQAEALRIAIDQATAPPMAEGDIGVAYVPEPVKQQIKEELAIEVLAQAREDQFHANQLLKENSNWKWFGDLRVRNENILYPEGNDITGAFPNFNAINTGTPFDTKGTQFAPQLNADEDRQRLRLRARIGSEVDLGDNFVSGFRFATGENNSPTSQNQSFGAAGSGQGGSFSKYAIWLDRAFLTYHEPSWMGNDATWYFGRFENPFFSSEVMWDDDIGFDGVALKGSRVLRSGVKGVATLGMFPIFNTDLNFSSIQPNKFASTDKWLYAAQLGLELKLDDDFTAKCALGYYDFHNAEGQRSSPFTPLTAQDGGDTDATRPSFAQKGNTYMPLRNIIANASNSNGNSLQYQYFGLATPFRNATMTGRLDYDGYEPVRLSLVAEAIKNVAFDGARAETWAVNNRGPDPDGDNVGKLGRFDGGDQALSLQFVVGKQALSSKGDWTTFLGYRYVESDAVIDGFTDSDFGGGGTNLKGFIIGGNLMVSRSVRLGMRWMTADEIAGPPLKTDVLQFDLSAKF